MAVEKADAIALVKRLTEAHKQLMDEMAKAIYGQREALELIMISLLCGNHSLLHGLPGLGKTLMANSLSKALEMDFCRIQFTPDLMPSDITGTDIIDEDQETGKRFREFMPGPIFANLVLADEINRTPPKTQAALLQAMQEHEVSVGRNTYKLKEPFMVLATQNPIEMEGTYVLPEAQLDRFMFCIKLFYPAIQEEIDIVKNTTSNKKPDINAVMNPDEIIKLQEIVRGTPVSDDVISYVVRLVNATRGEGVKVESVSNYVNCGASPRASQNLILGAKAVALLDGRYHVDFADVRKIVKPVLRHRLVMNFRAKADNVDSDSIIEDILAAVPQDA